MRVTSGLYGWLFLLLLLGLGGLAAACQPSKVDIASEVQPICNLQVPGSEPMSSSENETAIMKKQDIPPIDAAAPEQMETATFSLG